MTWIEQHSHFILDLFLAGISIYLAFFKNYLEEKGKNLATREDIEEITKKIEGVKSDVQYAYSQKSQLLEQNKVALTNFFDQYINWTEFSIKNISVVINHSYKSERIREVVNELSLQCSKVERSFWTLCLFEASDEKFIEQIKFIFLQAKNLHFITFDYLISLEELAIKTELQQVTQELITRKKTLTESFISDRDEKSQTLMKCTNLLMNFIRTKLLEKYE